MRVEFRCLAALPAMQAWPLPEPPEQAATSATVPGGARSSNGTPSFAGVVTAAQSQAIKAYIIDRAQALR